MAQVVGLEPTDHSPRFLNWIKSSRHFFPGSPVPDCFVRLFLPVGGSFALVRCTGCSWARALMHRTSHEGNPSSFTSCLPYWLPITGCVRRRLAGRTFRLEVKRFSPENYSRTAVVLLRRRSRSCSVVVRVTEVGVVDLLVSQHRLLGRCVID